MTPASGSRPGCAGSSHRAGGEGEGDGEGDGDGLDGDPEVRALRAVWRTMRDEDPPERGLAELLAAARATAEAMHARPTPWQRLIAGLRRPAGRRPGGGPAGGGARGSRRRAR